MDIVGRTHVPSLSFVETIVGFHRAVELEEQAVDTCHWSSLAAVVEVEIEVHAVGVYACNVLLGAVAHTRGEVERVSVVGKVAGEAHAVLLTEYYLCCHALVIAFAAGLVAIDTYLRSVRSEEFPHGIAFYHFNVSRVAAYCHYRTGVHHSERIPKEAVVVANHAEGLRHGLEVLSLVVAYINIHLVLAWSQI